MSRYLAFLTASLALLLISVSTTAMSVAFPSIITDLNTTLVLTGWTITSYQLTFIALVPLIGRVTEHLGRRYTLILFISLFSLGSILCGLASNIYLLIAFRVIQGIGGSGLVPCVTEIVSEEFPESRQRYIGLLSSIYPVGMIIGPNLGGLLVEQFGWRSVFLVNIPPGLLIITLALTLMKRNTLASKGKIDIKGALLLFSTLSVFMLFLTNLSEIGTEVSWTFIIVLLAASIMSFVLFVKWEQKAKQPIIDFALLKEKQFLAVNVFNILYGAGALGIVTLVPFYAVSVYGMSTFTSGFILTPRSIAMVVFAAVTSFILAKWGYRKPIFIGTLLVALSLFILGLEPRQIELHGIQINETTILLITMFISGVGIGIIAPAANNACIELMPDKVATITGLRIMFRQTGSALGVASSTVLVHLVGNAPDAFRVLLFGWTAIMVISIIPILFMPEKTTFVPCKDVDGKKIIYGDSASG